MSIKNALLGLVTEHEANAAALRDTFHERTDHVWPLNIGQVTQTLARLERDGLIEKAGERKAESGRHTETYRATDEGDALTHQWLTEAVIPAKAERDELTIKVSMAVAGHQPLQPIINAQRSAVMVEMRQLTRMLDDAPTVKEIVIKRRIFALESELRWLDYVEESHA